MNKKIITGLILLMGISILGIIAVQLVWMNNALRVKNELFSRSVNDAMNNTVMKLEDIHNFGVVNRMVFSDSVRWVNSTSNDFSFTAVPHPDNLLHFPDSLQKAPRPVRIIREFSPKGKNARIAFKMDSDTGSSVESYEFTFDVDADVNNKFRHIIIDGKDSNSEDILFLKRDSFFTENIDSLYSVGLVRIDSIVTNLDTFAVISPDISKRVEIKAGRLKKMANQVVTEISTWDVQTIDNELIKNVLSEELENRDIPINFEYGILKDSVFTEHEAEISDSLKLLNTEYKVDLYPNDIIQKNLKLAVYFPERESFIYRSLNWLLIASFLF
jgi:two-component system phosphate regulon sensor histidine kinase PhoR